MPKSFFVFVSDTLAYFTQSGLPENRALTHDDTLEMLCVHLHYPQQRPQDFFQFHLYDINLDNL